MRAGTSFDEPIRLAGGRNVVAASGGTFQRMESKPSSRWRRRW